MESMGSPAEKRIHARHPVKIPVTFRRMDDAGKARTLQDLPAHVKSAQTLDSSLGGMFVVCDEPMKVGDLLSLKIKGPHQAVPFSAFAEVAWVGPSGAGLQFLSVKKEDEARLEAFLRTVGGQA
jgi:hypothetical protein